MPCFVEGVRVVPCPRCLNARHGAGQPRRGYRSATAWTSSSSRVTGYTPNDNGSGSVPPEVPELSSQVSALLRAIAGTDRGRSATLVRHRYIQELIDRLCASNPCVDAFGGSSTIDGRWELLYSTAERFRSSPFFSAFQDGLIQDIDLASAIFAFTDAIPGAEIGEAIQDVNSQSGDFISRVKLAIFPGISGFVVTSSSFSGAGNQLEIVVNSTSVDRSNLLPFLDGFAVPVREAFERLRGPGATRVGAEVRYLDEELRIMQSPDRQVFVYGRLR